ncbi:tRNA uridine-5-carboxymethylaminomethyl(34) synthesis GTPase MnmE [Anaerosacchariphilus polymeriproducens]|uniref:tRNA modification GTPase MnmE n=1 Tax=Anaerosacchariphilus polymeriproducens TaxID=1812858 RepID=A0A371AVQ1_9FIRM|nr:tRNA uridine-5-carboxymethylaminomethyl(34) synthesis GTPase MnmE [Anaerosacchariphilus polymeriproducens]RDU23550.1 tRNA uridine-5-carboxymethylaminomethyl(34) synthesis GTPase MnmE [Anaerosacchariphilus polymeriproducens]
MKIDTIAAIATAVANSGIGKIRISGEDAITILGKIYQPKNNKKNIVEAKSHTIHYGFIVDQDIVIDEVLVLIMKAPNSYTKEDIVEIDCHGGILVVKKILEVIIKNGARLAEPGEFTKRAFLNGRIDLSQAEAVIDLINAKNDYARQSSVNQLKGAVSQKIEKIRKEIIHEVAFIESALDDPEHIQIDGYGENLLIKIENLISELELLLKSSKSGKIIKEGIKTVIIGKPNAGKSSLLNVLLGEERAIVTDIAGTTRDSLEESINLNGVNLNLVDTAGIRDTDDLVEQIGVNKAKNHLLNSDLIIYVVDATTNLDQNDYKIIDMIQDKKVIILLNKSDLNMLITEDKLKKVVDKTIITISTKENEGIDLLESEIKDMFYKGNISFNDQIYITNVRHEAAIKDAYNSLLLVKNSILDLMPEDFYSIDLMNAYESLGNVIGESLGEDLVNEIFSEFCMGK